MVAICGWFWFVYNCRSHVNIFYNCCSIVKVHGLFTNVPACGVLWFIYNCRSYMNTFTTVTAFLKAMDCLQSSPRVGGWGLFTIVVAMWTFFLQLLKHCGRSWNGSNRCNLWMVVVCLQLL